MTGCSLDRDQARAVLSPWATEAAQEILLDRLAGCVRPAAIDRDDLDSVLNRAWHDELSQGETRDAILALVRPVAAVTLTPEETRIVRWLLMYWGADDPQARKATPPSREAIQALAARLEAAQ